MDSHLIAFLLGFVLCGAGVIFALVFDIGMDRLSGWFKRIF
ncbi:hypothetical protein [Azonexus hydrophilus]|uniref:Uncharacterized protein n=1 Tax=Azonexus hydrophilus TaxID=418702 RepID=A0ABZ2XCF8_9RHOO